MRVVARNVVAESDGRHGDEAVVEGVQVVPVGLYGDEDGGRYEEHEDDDEREDDRKMDEANVDDAVEVTEAVDEQTEQGGRDRHQALHRSREEDQSEGDAQRCVDDAENLASLR